jgi:para-nitrobenzyl esterase
MPWKRNTLRIAASVLIARLFFAASGAAVPIALLLISGADSACAQLPLPANDPLPAQDPFVVHIGAGLVRGTARPGSGAEFLGIPYAQPPVGDLRWRAPEPALPWTGVREATKFGAACSQPLLDGAWNRYDFDHSQEDCLFLNVITPAWPAGKPLPVMFWIHGGADLGGSASSDLYKDGTLPEHGVVLVTINYRLGVFGFFAHPALTAESPHHASGNYGLMDQILALQWVRDNIARFGGDPSNITVFGQSAGSMNTGMLMTSPLARGLFEKAIAESGAAYAPSVPSLADAERFGEDAATALNVPAGAQGFSGPAAIAALRKIPAPDLLARLGKRASDWPGFTPDIDGWVLTRWPANVFAAGDEAPIPLLIGTTSREFGGGMPIDALRAAITQASGNLAPQALALYGVEGGAASNVPNVSDPAIDPIYGAPAAQWSADQLFHCPITTQALWHSAAHHATYEYELDHPIPGHEAEGAVHSGDLPYVFGYYPKTGNIGGVFGDVDLHLADQVETYWTNFARTGDPNDGSSSLGQRNLSLETKTGNPNSAGLPHWPALDAVRQSFLRFSLDGSAVVSTAPLRGAQCDLYRKALAQQMKPAH